MAYRTIRKIQTRGKNALLMVVAVFFSISLIVSGYINLTTDPHPFGELGFWWWGVASMIVGVIILFLSFGAKQHPAVQALKKINGSKKK